MSGVVVLPSLLFGLGLLSPNGWGQIFPKWPPPEQITLMIIPDIFASKMFFSHNEPQLPPVFPGDSQVGLTHILMKPLLLWDPVHI